MNPSQLYVEVDSFFYSYHIKKNVIKRQPPQVFFRRKFLHNCCVHEARI